MKPLIALAVLLVAAATLWYIRRPHDRPAGPLLHTWASDDPDYRVFRASDEDAIRWAWTRAYATGINDGVPPFDPRTHATGLAAA